MAKKYIELLEEELPPPKHKMYVMWRQYALNAIKKGRLLKRILSKFTSLNNIRILDVWCGKGGISIAFAEEVANVFREF